MQSSKSFIMLILASLLAVVVMSSAFMVKESQKAIVIYLGKVSRVYDEAGLKFKVPFLEEVVFLDKRLQGYVLPVLEINDSYKKKLVVDVYARYVIGDPVLYIKNIGVGRGVNFSISTSVIDQRLNRYVSSALRNTVGSYLLKDLLSDKRSEIMNSITAQVQKEAKSIGVLVEDVRLIKSNLPKANSEKVFLRMESDRNKVARRIRSEGDEQAKKIKADANRQVKEIIAIANRQAQVIKGEGEAQAMDTLNKAIAKDPAFFDYIRRLDSYKKSLRGASYVLSSDSPFFKDFLQGNAKKRG